MAAKAPSSGAKIYAIMNNKGGPGKTSTATNLAVTLARAGNRVLLVDSDQQANSTEVLANGKKYYSMYGATICDLYNNARFDVREAIVPAWFQLLRQEAPALKFEVHDFSLRHHADALASGDIDVVIGFEDHIDDALVKRTLFFEHYCCVVRHSSSLYHPGELGQIPAVRFSSGPGNIEDIINKCFEQAGIKDNVIATLPCYTTLPAFMAINDVVAFIPSAFARDNVFRIIPDEDIAEEFAISCAWHRKSQGNPLRKWLTERLTFHLKDCASTRRYCDRPE